MADSKLSALSAISVPALADPVYGQQAGTSGQYTLERMLAAIGLNPGGRLTLTTGVAITTADVTAAGTIYYTPYLHDRIRIYDGTRWKVYVFTQRSLTLSVTSGKAYDVFIYDNAGTLTLELSAAWTSDLVRADALTTQDGVTVKSGALTRLWLGTIYASGTNITEDSVLNRYVCNAYNAVLRRMDSGQVNDTHTYATNAWREWHGGTNAVRINFVSARAQDINFGVFTEITGGGAGQTAYVAANLDITTANGGFFPGTAAAVQISIGAFGLCPTNAAAGKHIIYPLQFGATSATFNDYRMTAGVIA